MLTDTPRSEAQFSNLVVCFPVSHQGGKLTVRNAGKKIEFDWSNASHVDKDIIQWAAFYSDCEHDMHEVTSGHRLTLAYNLFGTRGLGHLTGSPSLILNPALLPLYEKLRKVLEAPIFFNKGSILAIWLTHSCAHTINHINFLPSSLKGADMSFYETTCDLGLWCRVVPVIQVECGSSDYYEGKKGEFWHMNKKLSGSNKHADGSDLDEQAHPLKAFGVELPVGNVT
jgi:hypothetical protein